MCAEVLLFGLLEDVGKLCAREFNLTDISNCSFMTRKKIEILNL